MKRTILHEISSILFIVLISCFLHYKAALPHIAFPYNALLCSIVGLCCIITWIYCPIERIKDYVCSSRCSIWLCTLWIAIILCFALIPRICTCGQVTDIRNIHTGYAAIIAWGITWLCLSGKIIIPLCHKRIAYSSVLSCAGLLFISGYLIPGQYDTQEHKLTVNSSYTVFLAGGDSIKINSISNSSNAIADISILYASREHKYTLQANSPIRYKYWDISLLSYRRHPLEAILLLVYDPHRYIFLAGILLILVQWGINILVPIVSNRKRGTHL